MHGAVKCRKKMRKKNCEVFKAFLNKFDRAPSDVLTFTITK